MNELHFSDLSDQAAMRIHTFHSKGAISFLFGRDSS